MLGKFVNSIIHSWMTITGKTVDFEKFPFLQGPVAGNKEVGELFYEKVAEEENLQVIQRPEGGLLVNFGELLDKQSPYYSKLDAEIPVFYQNTAKYKLDVWSKWLSPFSWAAKLFIRIVSVEIKQLNIPLDPLETSYGMSSDVIQLREQNDDVKYTCWLRKSLKNNKVVYAGFYSSFQAPNIPYKYVRVIFPLPKGNVTVILRVDIQADGSVKLISDGKKYGETGYYRLHRLGNGKTKMRMIPIKEVIHVFRGHDDALRTDHFFRWWKITFLQLHYKISPKG